ncbi:hypothetical protein BCR43DRAFT_485911 [Syncephalastrum racemosum]|uniref:Uncharacterized protein n=1 Tax=Syncephalastrum racemosum TaxID=13706 RepID=A0A1X2HNH5_SYNRA|nr:hypothetical protein BCR43DRAFT_485911 [Syncephalastrum racemosum]
MSSNRGQRHDDVHFETTPRVYQQHYTNHQPSYDLYPGMSRRLGNGYVPRPSPPPAPPAKRQVNFAKMNMVHHKPRNSDNGGDASMWYNPHPVLDLFPRLPEEEDEDETPVWDLYPLVLRNVQNFGTDQMRQRLQRAMLV